MANLRKGGKHDSLKIGMFVAIFASRFYSVQGGVAQSVRAVES